MQCRLLVITVVVCLIRVVRGQRNDYWTEREDWIVLVLFERWPHFSGGEPMKLGNCGLRGNRL